MQSKVIIPLVICMVLSLSSVSYAGTNLIELDVGQSMIAGRYEHKMPTEHGFLTGGVGALYNDDEYSIGEAKFTLGDGISSAGLAFNLGFKGVIGIVEENSQEADLMAVSFLFGGTFTIPETVLPIPVDFSFNLALAPEPLCFLESERYTDFRLSFDFKIIKNAAVILGYRHIETRVEEEAGNWKMSDGTLFIGYQLKF
jgi:hypothetical protein